MCKSTDNSSTLQWVTLSTLLSMFLIWLDQSNCCSQLATVGVIVPSAIVLTYLSGLLSVDTLRTMRPNRADPHTTSTYLILVSSVASLGTLIPYSLIQAAVPAVFAGLGTLIIFTGGFWGLAIHEMRTASSGEDGEQRPNPGRKNIGLIVAYLGFVFAGYGLVASFL